MEEDHIQASPQLPSSIGKNMETSRIHQELLRRQPNNTTSTGAMDLEPGQPVFVKEVNGNIWEQPLLTNQQLSQIPIG